MDIQTFEGHLRYRKDNPPVGMMIKAIMRGISGDKGPTLEYTSEERPPQNDKEELQSFLAAFGASGAQVIKGDIKF